MHLSQARTGRDQRRASLTRLLKVKVEEALQGILICFLMEEMRHSYEATTNMSETYRQQRRMDRSAEANEASRRAMDGWRSTARVNLIPFALPPSWGSLH